jgi:hypothetical protein
MHHNQPIFNWCGLWIFSKNVLATCQVPSSMGLSSTPEARNLLCLANGVLQRHNFWLIAFLFFALLAKLRNQELLLFLANLINRQMRGMKLTNILVIVSKASTTPW